MSEIVLNLSGLAISLLAGAFCLYIICQIRKQTLKFGQGPIFDRSQQLVLLGCLANYFEIVCNIISASVIYYDIKNATIPNSFFTCVAVFFTRFYAGVMALRAYRIPALHNYRIGNSAKISELLVFRTNITTVLIYSTVTTIPAIVLFSVQDSNNVFDIYNRVVYGLEGALFLVSCFYIMKTKIHPSISVEHLFYSVFWISGAISSSKTLDDRRLYIVPIRNLCLVYISYLSLKAHCNLIRPPLPYDPIFSQIFEIEELYTSFLMYLSRYCSNEAVEACMLCNELAKCKFFNNWASFYKIKKFNSYSDEIVKSLEVGSIEFVQGSLEDILEPF